MALADESEVVTGPRPDDAALPARAPGSPASPRRRPWRDRLVGLAGLTWRPMGMFVLSRIGVLLVAGAVASTSHLTFAHTLLVWDGKWYMSAATGYPHHNLPGSGDASQNSLGFYPGLPILIALVHLVLRVHVDQAALLVTFATGLSASVAVWLFLRDTEDDDGVVQGTALVLFSPAAFVLSLVYSEGLLITAVAGALMMLRRRRWVAAGLFGAVATATDPIGLVIVLACAVAAYQAVRHDGDWRALIAPALAPLGTVAFFAYLWAWVGTPFAYIIAQHRGWQGGVPWASIPGEFGYLILNGFNNVNDTIKAASFLVILVLLVRFLRMRPPAPVVTFVLGALVVAAESPIIGWSPRVALRAFPLLALVGARLPRRWFGLIIAVSALTMAAVEAVTVGGGFTSFTP